MAQPLLSDGFQRARDLVPGIVDGLTVEQLAQRPDPAANSIAWLVWHLARVTDDHLADAYGRDQVWTADGWADRFGLDLPVDAIGYGFGPAQVAKVVAPAELLAGYHEAVSARTLELLDATADGDLPRVVDERWDPPVTLAVRLVSVLSDVLQHVGQAAYVRGLIERA